MFYVVLLKIKIVYFWQTKREFKERKRKYILYYCFTQPGPARQKFLICVKKKYALSTFLKFGIKHFSV